MKKLDFLIVLGIIIFIFIMYLLVDNNQSSNKIQIIINNEIIDELDIYNENIYVINSDDSFIYISKNNKIIKKINNKYQRDIYNVITIKDKKVNMSQSNCQGKDCMFMEISLNKKLPIICTNGIVIKISNNDGSDIIIN